MEQMRCENCGCGGELIISVDAEYLCSDCFAENVSNFEQEQMLADTLAEDALDEELEGLPDEEHHCATCGAFIDDIFAMPTEGNYYCAVCAPEPT